MRGRTKGTPRFAGWCPAACSATADLRLAHGEPQYAYYAEWEFPDDETFKAATSSAEFMASGKDARDRGLPRPIGLLADVS